VNYNNSLVVTITVTCYLWTPSTATGDSLFTCGAISRPPHLKIVTHWGEFFQIRVSTSPLFHIIINIF